MTPTELFTLLLTLITAALLVSSRLRPEFVALAAAALLALTGILTSEQAFSGLGSPIIITLLAISIIAEGLHQTGITYRLGTWMNRLGKGRPTRFTIITLLTAALLSLFLNNIAVVAVLLPAAMTLSRQGRVPPSRLLLPLAYGTLLGGMATLLTTANIVVAGSLEQAGYRPFGLLDFLPIGIPIVLAGTAYMLFAQRWLPGGERPALPLDQDLLNLYELGEELFLVTVPEDCPLALKTIAEGEWQKDLQWNILALRRGARLNQAPAPGETIRPGDILLLQGKADAGTLARLNLTRLQDQPLFSMVNDAVILTEVMLAPRSSLIDKTLRDLRFRERFGLNALSLWRGDHPHHGELPNLPLRCGDVLLVQGPVERVNALPHDLGLILLRDNPDAATRPGKKYIALAITALALIVAATGLLPVAPVFLAGAVLMLVTGCLAPDQAYQSIEWRTLFLIAGIFSISLALQSTGLVERFIHIFLDPLGNVSPLIIAAALLLFTLLVTQILGGQVTAVLLAPFAITIAQSIGLEPYGFAMAVALGCSLGFLTPYGHAVNLMVMNPGNYRFSHFVKIGAPLTAILFIIILLGLHLVWGV